MRFTGVPVPPAILRINMSKVLAVVQVPLTSISQNHIVHLVTHMLLNKGWTKKTNIYSGKTNHVQLFGLWWGGVEDSNA